MLKRTLTSLTTCSKNFNNKNNELTNVLPKLGIWNVDACEKRLREVRLK